jgi:protease IV
MDKRAVFILVFVFGGLFLVFFGFLLLALMSARSTDTLVARGPQVGVVEIEDMIVDSKHTLEALERFRKDGRIRGVIVRIDSPGGAVAPSQEIHDAIRRTAEEKRVVVSMANLAASGGYYIAVAGDEIVANPGTITGSIGVISQFTNLEGLAEWARVDIETLKAGEFKDVGSPFRQMTEDERAYFQALLEDIHSQFLEAVAAGRGVEVDEIRPYADGRIFTGQQALQAGLVDHLGGFDFAVDRMMVLAELRERPQLVYPKRDEMQILRELFGTASRAFAGGIREEVRATGLRASGPSFWFLPAGP